MGRSEAMRELVFLVGAPRSGTTWLQLLLAQSPRIATVNETHLFNNYLQSFFHHWRTLPDNARRVGLSPFMSDDEIEALVGTFADRILARIGARKPEATHILEKTPDHARYGPDILRLYRDAYFVHLVRDPRAVVSSLRHVARDWGGEWAPSGVVANTLRWRRDVRRGRGLVTATERYLEVRYEDLLDDGVPVLGKIFAFLQIEALPEQCAAWLDACRPERLQDTGGTTPAHWPWRLDLEPEGFFRCTGTTWRDALSAGDVAVVEAIAGDLMDKLGYTRQAARWRMGARVRLYDLLERLEHRLSQWRRRL